MRHVRVQTNSEQSFVTGRNGTHRLAAVHVWRASSGSLFFEGVGRSGKILNAGFVIDRDAARELVKEIIREFGE